MDGNKPFFLRKVDVMQPVKALKKYGQNFLKNENVLRDIANLVQTNENDLILEIGPGMGALTEHIIKKDSFLLCYEIDERMKDHLQKYENDKTTIIYDDFMKRDMGKDLSNYSYENLYVIANIPYYITSPILLKLINSNLSFQKIVLLVQKEFAERLTATHNHKEYNALTLYVDYFYDAKLCFLVNRENFVPAPKVDSAVISLERKENERIINQVEYFNFIREAFQNKRKTLKNNLKEYDWNKIVHILKELGYLETVRAEEISKEDFKKLWEIYQR